MFTDETIALAKAALGTPDLALAQAALGKAYTQATGLVAYDLRGPSLKMFPIITPLRNEIPRVGGAVGTATNWKAITAINPSRFSAGVSEGHRGAVIDQTEVDYIAAFRGLGLENNVTFEADYASRTFEDLKAAAALQTLQSLMVAEEGIIFGGNTSLALGTTPTPAALATATTGGSIAASTTVSIICVALTRAGYVRASIGAAGVIATVTKTNADATTDTFGGGAAQKSAAATIATGAGTATNTVSATVAPVFGAVAYAWFAGTAGNERISQITTINSVLITTLPLTPNQLASALPASDNSTNGLVFDGLLTMASKSGNGGYRASLATGTAGTGTALTSDGAGSVSEFVAAFTYFWDNYKVSPDQILCSGADLIAVTKLVLANGGVPLVHYTLNTSSQNPDINAGARLRTIYNALSQTWVEIVVHPDATPGTILFRTRSIPYGLNGVANIVQMLLRQDYYQIEWPLRTRMYEYGVYMDGVLQHRAPFSLGVLNNVKST